MIPDITFTGQIRGDHIVLKGNPELLEGADVRVEVVGSSESAECKTQPPLGRTLMDFAGKAVGLPPDASRKHDHYLYGTPKR